MQQHRHQFNSVEKFCEICKKRLMLHSNIDIVRKRFCSRACRCVAMARKRSAEPLPDLITCSQCGVEKPATAFFSRRNEGTALRVRQPCKTCHRVNVAKAAKEHPEWSQRIKARRKQLRKSLPFRLESVIQFGLTAEKALKLFKAQGGVCALCKKSPAKHNLALDHDHGTGKARQFLCPGCNGALAVLENTVKLPLLLDYLRQHGKIICLA